MVNANKNPPRKTRDSIMSNVEGFSQDNIFISCLGIGYLLYKNNCMNYATDFILDKMQFAFDEFHSYGDKLFINFFQPLQPNL